MASNISDLIHRVASSSCLSVPLSLTSGDYPSEPEDPPVGDPESDEHLQIWEEEKDEPDGDASESPRRNHEMEALIAEVFDAVSVMKRAYVGLQAAHSPWDPDKMRAADAAVVAEFRRLGRLRDRFRRGSAMAAAPPLREMVAPYEAALEEMRTELKTKDAELINLKERLKKKARSHSSKRFASMTTPTGAATPEMLEAAMEEVKGATRSFSARLISLMRSAGWDMAAAVEDKTKETKHGRHAVEAHVMRRMFSGFENESFYMEGTLASLLRPEEFRREKYQEYRDMKGMEPAELVGVLPTCQFGRFAARKYLAIVEEGMEERVFGAAEQRRAVEAGKHPRTGFYREFLRVAKAVWMLHLLVFAMDPKPSYFEVGKGAEFSAGYMESVVRFTGGRVPAGWAVGFPVAPGFKLGNESVIRARVYLVPKC